MRGIGRDVGEEGSLLFFFLVDPSQGGGEEEVGAVALVIGHDEDDIRLCGEEWCREKGEEEEGFYGVRGSG